MQYPGATFFFFTAVSHMRIEDDGSVSCVFLDNSSCSICIETDVHVHVVTSWALSVIVIIVIVISKV